MELAVVDQYFDHIAGDRSQDLVSVDFASDDGLGGDNGGCRPRNDDVVAGFEDGVQTGFDIGPFADNSLDDGSAADLVFDCLDSPARAGRHAIGARLEFAIGEILGLWWSTARELRFELRRLLL
jgi:hypothetical protein